MKIVILQEVFIKALAILQPVIEKRSTIPVLQNLLITKGDGNKIHLRGTDLDLTIETDAEAVSIAGDDPICVPAAKLFNIVKQLPKCEISISGQDNHWITLKAAKSNYKIAGVDPTKFAEKEPSAAKKPTFSILSEKLRQMIERTAFAITNEQSRFTLSGAKVEVADGHIRMVATDGHRLALCEIPFDGGKDDLDVLVPKKALYEIAKLGVSGGIQLSVDKNHVFATAGGTDVTARRLTGSFPNYAIVLPKDNTEVATVGAEDLKAAIRRVALMADERGRSIKISLKSGELTVAAVSSEEGDASETVACEYEGDEITLSFQWMYLYEFLNVATRVKPETRPDAADSETPVDTLVNIRFKDANAAVELNVAGDETWRYVAMPLRS